MSRFMQLVLDLFEAPPSHAAPPVHVPALTPQQPLLQGPHQPAEPLAQVLPKAQFTHPRATRRILLGTTDVAYAFRRGKRRTIGMVVGPDGLEVSAPTWVTVGEVESALRQKAEWISRKLIEMGERHAQMGAQRIVWCDGVVVPYLGGQLKVVLDSGSALKKNSAQFEPALHDLSPHTLRLALPLHATPEQIRDAVQAWLMRQAKALFTERLHHFAPLLNVQWQRLSLSSAATRWGSASSSGAIRLNWRLVHHKLDVIDYVVAHELSHLRVMDHSPRFWDTVKTVMPDYAERRRVLKSEALPLWH
ncbi:metal-dependent hydrolase [Limnohabitans sp. B9-3]|nr:metal-dependent hydrolase [Limnohabitans sp. B9-3]